MVIFEIASHRNGCFGEPFHAVRFAADGDVLLGFVFADKGRVAVIDAALAQETVAFGENSWRGDIYEDDLRAAIKRWPGEHATAEARPTPVLSLVASN